MEYTEKFKDTHEHKNIIRDRKRVIREWAKQYLKESPTELLQTSGKQINFKYTFKKIKENKIYNSIKTLNT